MAQTLNGNRFDKDVLYFPKSSICDSAFDSWLSKSTYWAQLENKSIEELHSILSFPLQLLANVPALSEYVQTWKFAAFNSIFYVEFKSGKVKKHIAWDEQPNIDFAMKRALYRYHMIFTICLIFFITCVKLSFNMWLILFLCICIFDMF